MLRSLVEVLIALIELLEAEAGRLGAAAKRIGIGWAVLATAAFVASWLLLFASALLVWSLYLALAAPLGPALSALICGLAIWCFVAVAAVIGARTFRG